MKKVTLVADVRTETGKNASRRLRASGKIPGVVYAKGKETGHVIVDDADFRKKVKSFSETVIIELAVGKEEVKDVLIKDFQRKLIKDSIVHLDFIELIAGQKISLTIPLNYVGNPIGVQDGGLLELHLHELSIECLPKDIPDAIEIDISGVKLTSSMHANELTMPAGVTMLEAPNAVLVSVSVMAAEVVTEEVEEALESVEVPSEKGGDNAEDAKE